MKVGDKVRFIHSTGEGIIRKINDNKMVEVEIEDGFIIPAAKNELVVIHSDESSMLGTLEKVSSSTGKGFLIGLISFNDKLHSLFLINDTSDRILFSLNENSEGKYNPVSSGVLESNDYIKLKEFNISEFEHWPELFIQAIFVSEGKNKPASPFEKIIKLKVNTFFKNRQMIPVINKEGYLFKIEKENKIEIDPEKLTEKMFESQSTATNNFSKPSKEIDLHIKKLVADFSNMSNSEMLELQIKTFEKNLDQAIASGMDEIIFIHGVGNGVLKNHIHKLLSQNKGIKFFKDAMKEKFGYGATLVRIK